MKKFNNSFVRIFLAFSFCLLAFVSVSLVAKADTNDLTNSNSQVVSSNSNLNKESKNNSPDVDSNQENSEANSSGNSMNSSTSNSDRPNISNNTNNENSNQSNIIDTNKNDNNSNNSSKVTSNSQNNSTNNVVTVGDDASYPDSDYYQKYKADFEYQLTDINNKPQLQYKTSDHMRVHVKFSIPDEQVNNISAGKTITLTLPKALSIDSGNFEIKDRNDSTRSIANVSVNKITGEMKLTFTNYFDGNLSDFNADFNVVVHWADPYDKVKQNTVVPIKWDNGKNISPTVVPANPKPAPNPKPNPNVPATIGFKWGIINDTDHTIMWGVGINKQKLANINLKYVDNIGPNQTLLPNTIHYDATRNISDINSIGVDPTVTPNSNDQIIDEGGAKQQLSALMTPANITNITNNSFEMDFSNLSDYVYLTYNTRIDDDYASIFYNNGGNVYWNSPQYPNNQYQYLYGMVSIFDGDGSGGGNKIKIDISGRKYWEDNNNVAQRPASVKIGIYANGHLVYTQDVTAATNWTYTFLHMIKDYSPGHAIQYSVQEVDYPTSPVNNAYWQVDSYDKQNNTYNVTNYYNTAPPKITIQGTKIWKDNNNAANERPGSITVDLLANGNIVQSQQVSAANNWNFKFTNLDQKDSSDETIKYSVKEDQVPTDYEESIDNGNIVNTYIGTTPNPTPEPSPEPTPNPAPFPYPGPTPVPNVIPAPAPTPVPGSNVYPTPNNHHNKSGLANIWVNEPSNKWANDQINQNKYPIKPSNSESPQTSNNNANPNFTDDNNNHQLPQTGERINIWTIILGVLMLFVTLIILVLKFKKLIINE